MWSSILVNIVLCLVLVSAAVPKKDRVVDAKLSDEEPGSKEYDHDAFLGEEQANEFDKLSPEESKRRLGMIFDRIDTDDDNFVSSEELEKWVTLTQQRYVHEDSEKEFKNHDEDQDGTVHWDEYYKMNFGFLQDEDWKAGHEQGFSYKDMLARDQVRWKNADLDGDNSCSLDEYKAFLHPEEYEHMQDLVLTETLVDMDKDGDGAINLAEYIGDMYKPEKADEEEPEWVQTEREQFKNHRDADKDGMLNRQELKQWILPDNYNHATAEAAHLIYAADGDEDKKLTKEEMVNHYDVFVGSQATEWGEMFKRHDEF